MSKRNPSVNDRVGYLGGSDAAACLGLSPYCSPMQLFGVKRGINVQMPLDPATESRFYFGHLLEDSIGRAVTHYHHIKIKRLPQFVRSEKYPFMGGHIDFDVPGDDRAFLECKNIRFDSDEWAEDFSIERDCSTKVPVYYLAQCDHYMVVRDCTYCYLAALVGGCELRVYRICRDPAREKMLIDAELAMWNRIEQDDPPFGKTADDFVLALQYGYVQACSAKEAKKKDPIILDTEATLALSVLAASRKAAAKHNKAAAQAREMLIERIHDFGYLCNDKGEELGSMLSQKRRTFDDFSFKLKHPDLYERFTRETQIVMIRTKGSDEE